METLAVFSGMVSTVKIKVANLDQAVRHDYILATDLADYLVKKGEAFRNAHHILARLVNYATEKNKALAEISLGEYQEFSPLFTDDVYSGSG